MKKKNIFIVLAAVGLLLIGGGASLVKSNRDEVALNAANKTAQKAEAEKLAKIAEESTKKVAITPSMDPATDCKPKDPVIDTADCQLTEAGVKKLEDFAVSAQKAEAEKAKIAADAAAKSVLPATPPPVVIAPAKVAGSYVTLADFNANSGKFAATKNVYFFHAAWCPTCVGIDREIKADLGKIPTSTTLIKTDFDSETALRQKYGVTTQYTFVQFDASGNLVKKWSATNFDKVIAGIN